jgi:DNA-directed RNA polymerase subunit K/omega
VIHQSSESNSFETVRVATLRAVQLKRGCRPRVPASHRWILTAQLEIAAGKVHADARTEGPRPSYSPPRDVEPVLQGSHR